MVPQMFANSYSRKYDKDTMAWTVVGEQNGGPLKHPRGQSGKVLMLRCIQHLTEKVQSWP